MSSREKIAYVKGLLAAGKPKDDFDCTFFKAVVEALDSLADEIEDGDGRIGELQEDIVDLADFCEELSEDLDTLEGGWDNSISENIDEKVAVKRLNYESILCPFCSTMFYYHPDLSDEEGIVNCPNCNRIFKASEVDLEEEE